MAGNPIFTISPKQKARFWAKVDVRGPDDCWPWLAANDGRGYGRVRIGAKITSAAHVSLTLSGRPRPGGQMSLHSCDNPPCVNPKHLRWGTQAENIDDMMRRRRNVAVVKPDCYATGKRNGANTKPDRAPRGPRHGSKTKPWCCPRGESNGRAVLTAAQVVAIRAAPHFHGVIAALARQLGVSTSTIGRLRAGQGWKHIA